MSEHATHLTVADDDAGVVLPEPVRQRVVALVAEELPGLAADELPSDLRPFARFTPSRRAKLGGRAISARLAVDPVFRQRISARVVAAAGPFGTAVADGTPPATADPVEVAALAYLTRPSNWADLMSRAAASLDAHGEQTELRARERDVERLTEQLERLKVSAHNDLAKARAELAAARAEAEELRSRARELTKALKNAEAEAKRAHDTLATERGRAAVSAAAQDAELRRARARLSDVESELDAAKRVGREGRSVDEARLWLLLETMSQAAQGVRRELALNPPTQSPADLVAAGMAETAAAPSRPMWAADDPSRLDQLVNLPKAHLVVDGYNVTKTGFGDVSLEQQRTRLVTSLGGLVAQSGAEVTVVFDGAERLPVAPAAPRGVRVLFSARGQTADEVIRRLVRAEPPGRPVIVVSSDKEVAAGVRRAGAYAVASSVLLDRFSRS